MSRSLVSGTKSTAMAAPIAATATGYQRPSRMRPVCAPMAMLIASSFTALMAVFKYIDVHSDTYIGLWLTVIGGLVAAYGAYEMGGRIAMPTGSSST